MTSIGILQLLRLLALLGSLFSVGAHSAPDSNSAPLPAGPVGTGDVLGLGASLIAVIGAVLLVGWLYRRVQRGAGQSSDIINVIAARPIGPKERILVVEIADKQLVVGMTATQVQTLHVFDEPVSTQLATTTHTGFAVRLKTAVKEFAR